MATKHITIEFTEQELETISFLYHNLKSILKYKIGLEKASELLAKLDGDTKQPPEKPLSAAISVARSLGVIDSQIESLRFSLSKRDLDSEQRSASFEVPSWWRQS